MYLINRTPSKVLDGKTPYELMYGTTPSYDAVKTFGCLSFAHKATRDKDKFGERSRKCVFVGYPYGQKGWKLFDLETEQFFVSRDVVFNEEVYPYQLCEDEEMSGMSLLSDNVRSSPEVRRLMSHRRWRGHL